MSATVATDGTHCLACLAIDVHVEAAGTEVPTCGPSATAPSAYFTEDRCGECGSDRLTDDLDEVLIRVTDALEARAREERLDRALADDVHSWCHTFGASSPLVRERLAKMSPHGRAVACLVLGLGVDAVEAEIAAEAGR